MKTQVIESLGQSELLLPVQIEAGLAANDRLKYYFTLLQVARNHADAPLQPAPSLKPERLAAAIEDATLDTIATATRQEGGRYRVPGYGRLVRAIADDLRIMAAPADPAARARVEKLLGTLPPADGDLIEGAAIDAMTRADRDKGDSVHRAVMDLHKVLNALQAQLAEEEIDGAAAYNLRPGDEPLVRAFMAGVNRTSRLKFNHPGLGTAASRSGSRLVIQNDIGTTDAHVIVIHVEGRKVTLTHSDVHLDRLQFFRAMFDRFAVAWTEPQSNQTPALAGGAPFFLTTATFAAKDRKQLLDYLEFLGSRLVFLIDWNRARKQLRGVLRGEQRVRLLRWAADAEVGHRAFLELGGARLIYGAVEATAGEVIHFGDRLCDVLGDEAAFAFLQFAFKTATEGLLAHQSEGLIRDRIKAELLNRLNTVEGRLLTIAVDHAGLLFEIATSIRDALLAPKAADGESKTLAKRARRWEHEADQLVVETVEAIRRRPDLEPFHRLMNAADDAADDLEEVAFLLGLLDGVWERRDSASLTRLTAILADAAQEWVKAVSHAQHVQRQGSREDADDFLTAIDRLGVLEHDADDAERAVTVAALGTGRDFRELHLLTEIGRGLEQAADSLKRASLLLRDHVLADVLAA